MPESETKNPILPFTIEEVEALVSAAKFSVDQDWQEDGCECLECQAHTKLATALKPFTQKKERFWIDEHGDLRDREDVDDSAITLKGAANLLNELATSTKEGS